MRKALDNPNLDPDRKVKYQARSALHLAAGYGQYSVAEELLFVRSHHIVIFFLYLALQSWHTFPNILFTDHVFGALASLHWDLSRVCCGHVMYRYQYNAGCVCSCQSFN